MKIKILISFSSTRAPSRKTTIPQTYSIATVVYTYHDFIFVQVRSRSLGGLGITKRTKTVAWGREWILKSNSNGE